MSKLIRKLIFLLWLIFPYAFFLIFAALAAEGPMVPVIIFVVLALAFGLLLGYLCLLVTSSSPKYKGLALLYFLLKMFGAFCIMAMLFAFNDGLDFVLGKIIMYIICYVVLVVIALGNMGICMAAYKAGNIKPRGFVFLTLMGFLPFISILGAFIEMIAVHKKSDRII